MRVIAVGGLLLYGVANLFAGLFDLATDRGLALGVDAALLITGGLLVASGILAMRRSRFAFRAGSLALVLALALAVFNERVLGLGHPSHHIMRGLYTVAVFWSLWKSRSA